MEANLPLKNLKFVKRTNMQLRHLTGWLSLLFLFPPLTPIMAITPPSPSPRQRDVTGLKLNSASGIPPILTKNTQSLKPLTFIPGKENHGFSIASPQILVVGTIQNPKSSSEAAHSAIQNRMIAQTQTGFPAAADLVNQGLQLIGQGKLTEAIAAFRQASQLDPKMASAHYNLGLALRQVGQLQPAADAFYQATQADPSFALAFANLGAALLEGSNLQQAKDYLERALQLDPKLGVGHYNFGLVFEQQGIMDKALASFKQAMQYSPKAPEPAYHLGLVYLQQNKVEEAKKAFQQAIQISPKYPEAHYNLGSILLNQGNLNPALEAFRKSAEANSNYANAYYGAGLVFLRQNRYSDAQRVLQYAKDLYTAQGITQWAANAEQLLQQARNPNAQSR
jgi:tetratricopeptide (TPR) repeat protein